MNESFIRPSLKAEPLNLLINEFTEAENKDEILKFSIKYLGEIISSYLISKKVFLKENQEEVKYLMSQMKAEISEYAKFIETKRIVFIKANSLTEKFLNNGGFTNIEKVEFNNEQKVTERELKQDKILDLKLKTFESLKLSVKFEYKFDSEEEVENKCFEVNMFLIDKIGKYKLKTEEYAVSDYWLRKCRETGRMGWTNTDDNHIKGLMTSFSRKLKDVFRFNKVELLNVDYFDEGNKFTEGLYELTELERNEITNSYLRGHREERIDPAGDAWNDILNGDGWKHGLD